MQRKACGFTRRPTYSAVISEIAVPKADTARGFSANVMLDEFDKELERRGHRFCRYADDCNIFLRTRKAGQRVMDSVVGFLEGKLKLKVNREKSAVDSATRRKFLGFSFYYAKDGVHIRVHPKSLERLKTKLKDGTGRSDAMSMETRITRLNDVVRGWVNYFCIADMKKQLQVVDENLRRRLRMCLWKQWKRICTKHRNLVRLGIPDGKAWEHANTRKGYWRTAGSPILATALTNEYFAKLGLQSLTQAYDKARDSRRTAVCRTACTVV